MNVSLAALLYFFLLLHLRKTLKTFSPDAAWDRRLKLGMIAVGVLFVLDAVFPIEAYTQWLWHLGMFYLVSLAFRNPLFAATRMTMYAVLPLAALSFLRSVLSLVAPFSWQKSIDTYEDFAFPVAVTWMIALLILSQRQLKALKVEHQKRIEEEKELQRVEALKVQLEALVAERTAELVKQKEELHEALHHLKSTQDQLIQREKMASLGELIAGIAHEIQNPLNFVNNFSETNAEMLTELKNELAAGNKDEALSLANELIENERRITHHGKRAASIVRSMLQHSGASTGVKEPTDINALTDEYLRMSYHGLRAKDKSFTAKVLTEFDPAMGELAVAPQELGRVLLNLYNNAFYTVREKKKQLNGYFEPTIQVSTRRTENGAEIVVRDNGNGIPQNVLDKIYQPFFTTKPAGMGTGLGLSLSYDIVTKGHGGELSVETKEGEGTEFRIILPAQSI